MDALHHIPINKTAALVISKGFQYVPDKKIVNFHSEICPPLRPIERRSRKNPEFIDLTGVRFGEFRVVGLPIGRRGWVVRCRCGAYEIRKTKSILNKENFGDRCQSCRHVRYLKRKAEFIAYGENHRDSRKY